MQRKKTLNQRFLELLVLAGVLVLTTLLIQWTGADQRLSRLVFNAQNGWIVDSHSLWAVLYRWAPLPAIVLAAAGLLVCIASFVKSSLSRFRAPSLFLFLTLVLGPGLLVNTLLKDHLGRARPRELIEFGGQYRFTHPFQKGDAGKNSSFPSGHAAVAFYLMTPWFVLRNRYRGPAVGCLVTGIGYGLFVGTARIVQGAHFLSDVLWAGGLVYLVAGVLALILGIDPPD